MMFSWAVVFSPFRTSLSITTPHLHDHDRPRYMSACAETGTIRLQGQDIQSTTLYVGSPGILRPATIDPSFRYVIRSILQVRDSTPRIKRASVLRPTSRPATAASKFCLQSCLAAQ
jgi:hypothetical protein